MLIADCSMVISLSRCCLPNDEGQPPIFFPRTAPGGSEVSAIDHCRVNVTDCEYSAPLGMISGDVQDWQLSASSTYPQEWDKNCHERYARLYQANGRGWCARYKTSSEWLQVDLGVAAKVGVPQYVFLRFSFFQNSKIRVFASFERTSFAKFVLICNTCT